MTFNRLEKSFREQMLATGLFKWVRKNIYKLVDVDDFLKSPEDFNQKLKNYNLKLDHVPKYGLGELDFNVIGDTHIAFIFISHSRKNIELLVKYKINLQKWFNHDHYQLSDEHFDNMKRRLNEVRGVYHGD